MKLVDIPDEELNADFDPNLIEVRGGFRWIKPYWKLKRFRVSNPMPGTTFENVLQKKFNTARSRAKQVAKERYSLWRNGEWQVINDPEMIVEDGMMFQYVVHVHEPPVTADLIQIIYEDHNYLIINKPSSMPSQVNPPYYQNSVLGVLYSQYPRLRFLSLIHRLDLVTSGVLMIGKSSDAVTAIREKMQVDPSEESSVRKHYVARVKGEFPDETLEVTKRLCSLQDRKRSETRIRYLEDDEVAPSNAEWVKTARTVFRRLSYHSITGTSTVEAWIVTGRTHQIRVHLLSLGHPIVNDPEYGLSATRRQRRYNIQEGDTVVCEDCGATYFTEVDVIQSHMIYLHSLDYAALADPNDSTPMCQCVAGCGGWNATTGSYYFHTAVPGWLDDSQYAAKYFGRDYYEPNFPGSRYGPDDVQPQRPLPGQRQSPTAASSHDTCNGGEKSASNISFQPVAPSSTPVSPQVSPPLANNPSATQPLLFPPPPVTPDCSPSLSTAVKEQPLHSPDQKDSLLNPHPGIPTTPATVRTSTATETPSLPQHNPKSQPSASPCPASNSHRESPTIPSSVSHSLDQTPTIPLHSSPHVDATASQPPAIEQSLVLHKAVPLGPELCAATVFQLSGEQQQQLEGWLAAAPPFVSEALSNYTVHQLMAAMHARRVQSWLSALPATALWEGLQQMLGLTNDASSPSNTSDHHAVQTSGHVESSEPPISIDGHSSDTPVPRQLLDPSLTGMLPTTVDRQLSLTDPLSEAQNSNGLAMLTEEEASTSTEDWKAAMWMHKSSVKIAELDISACSGGLQQFFERNGLELGGHIEIVQPGDSLFACFAPLLSGTLTQRIQQLKNVLAKELSQHRNAYAAICTQCPLMGHSGQVPSCNNNGESDTADEFTSSSVIQRLCAALRSGEPLQASLLACSYRATLQSVAAIFNLRILPIQLISGKLQALPIVRPASNATPEDEFVLLYTDPWWLPVVHSGEMDALVSADTFTEEGEEGEGTGGGVEVPPTSPTNSGSGEPWCVSQTDLLGTGGDTPETSSANATPQPTDVSQPLPPSLHQVPGPVPHNPVNTQHSAVPTQPSMITSPPITPDTPNNLSAVAVLPLPVPVAAPPTMNAPPLVPDQPPTSAMTTVNPQQTLLPHQVPNDHFCPQQQIPQWYGTPMTTDSTVPVSPQPPHQPPPPIPTATASMHVTQWTSDQPNCMTSPAVPSIPVSANPPPPQFSNIETSAPQLQSSPPPMVNMIANPVSMPVMNAPHVTSLPLDALGRLELKRATLFQKTEVLQAFASSNLPNPWNGPSSIGAVGSPLRCTVPQRDAEIASLTAQLDDLMKYFVAGQRQDAVALEPARPAQFYEVVLGFLDGIQRDLRRLPPEGSLEDIQQLVKELQHEQNKCG